MKKIVIFVSENKEHLIMQIKYLLFYSLFLFLLSCGSKDNDPVEPDTSKTTTIDKKETEEKTDKKEETKATADKNTPPTAAVLTVPADGATAIALNNIDFSWDASTDAEGDVLTYDVYFGENNQPPTKIASNLSGKSTSLIDGLKGNTTYYWYVTTKDGKEGGETSSEIRSFTTTNTPPTAAMLTAPADGATVVLVGHLLSWDVGTDADGDDLTYDVYLDENNPPTTKVASDVTILSAPISQTNAPEGSTTYYWLVTTKDDKGGETKSGVRSFTTAVRPANKAALKIEIDNAIGRKGNDADLGYIDTSLITDMSELFRDYSNFNGDVSKWNTSNVKTMESMFRGATSFNADLSKWDVSKVENMSFMFHNATNFEGGDLRKWDVSKVTNMYSMFYSDTGNDKFKGNISTWDVSNVTDMGLMFHRATSFNQDISGWRPTRITNMYWMFKGATSFNQDLDSWNIASSVTKTEMFKDSGLESNPPRWYNP